MLKANKKTLIITSIITILPIFVGIFLESAAGCDGYAFWG